ncbi:MAG: aldo/keto reductase [Pirellulaceae bacterium]
MIDCQLHDGTNVPALGLGTWKMSSDEAEAAVYNAIQLGYRHIDCAWIYGNEDGVGRGIARAMADGIVTRDDLWLTSKLWNDCHRSAEVRPAIEATLNLLGIHYLDLYLMHWPIAHQHGVARPENASGFLSLQDAPLDRTWVAMDECRASGLSRYIGVSNFNIPKLSQLTASTGIRPAVNQVESHPFLQQRQLLEYCRENQIAFTAYSPLGSGDRPDAMKRENEPSLFQNETVIRVAEGVGVSVAQLLLAWGLQRQTLVIPKSASPDNMKQNLGAADLTLPDSAISELNALERGYRFVDGTFWEVDGGPYTADWLWNQ